MGNVIRFKANDSLRSVVAGLGDPFRDKIAGAAYGFQCLDDQQLANIYRSNWLGRKIVDIPAMDAVRKGRNWQAAQDQIELIEAEENRLGFWHKLLEAKTKARLWGGAALYIGTGDSDLMSPLNPERIGRAGIRYLTVLSRRDIAAGTLEQDVLSEFYGRPAYYEMTGAGAMLRVHPSRLATFIGAPHGDRLLAVGANQGWGDSVLESVYAAMRHADATAANIASLVFEANVDVFRIPDFMASLADPAYAARLTDRFTLAATAKGINRALILDKDEEYERRQVNFATLPEVMQSFLQMAAGAADIPATRLLGQSPAGMNATGDSDMLNYYDRVASMQALEVTPSLYRLDECLIRSALGTRPPEIFYNWAPLKQMSEKELAEIGKLNAETANILKNAGIYSAEELKTVVTNQLVEQGFYPGLDQVVKDAELAEEEDAEEEDVDDGEGPDEDDPEDDDPEGGPSAKPVTDAKKKHRKGGGIITPTTRRNNHFDPNQPRNGEGEWVNTGASGKGGSNITTANTGASALNIPGQSRKPTKAQRAAIEDYTGWRHGPINEYLRGLGLSTPQIRETIKHLNALLNPASFQESITVYRRVGGFGIDFSDLKPGIIVTEKAFLSTSRILSVTGSFARRAPQPVTIEMSVPKGARAVDIAEYSQYPEQAEILFARYTRMKIISIDRDNRYVKMEYVMSDSTKKDSAAIKSLRDAKLQPLAEGVHPLYPSELEGDPFLETLSEMELNGLSKFTMRWEGVTIEDPDTGEVMEGVEWLRRNRQERNES